MEDSKDQILKQEMPLAFARVEESSVLLVGATQIFKNDPTSPEGRKKLLDGARGNGSLDNILRGDLFVCHVTGAQKYNLLCFSVGRLIKKDGCMIYLQNKTKIQRFLKVRQRENHARSLGFFAYITVNMAVISNTSDNCILVSKILSVLYVSQPSDATKNVAQSINYKVKHK